MKIMKINGLDVKNSRRAAVLHITATDIKRGRVKDPTGCAAAVCARRQLGATEARVHVGRTYLRFNGHWKRYMTSPALRSEIVAFDRGGKFEPGDYTLGKMQPSRASDVSRDDGKPRRKYKKRSKIRHVVSGVRPMGLNA